MKVSLDAADTRFIIVLKSLSILTYLPVHIITVSYITPVSEIESNFLLLVIIPRVS